MTGTIRLAQGALSITKELVIDGPSFSPEKFVTPSDSRGPIEPRAGTPADYTFTPADRGQHTFTVTFQIEGVQTLLSTDQDHPDVTGSATVVAGDGGAGRPVGTVRGPLVLGERRSRSLAKLDGSPQEPDGGWLW